MKKHGKDNQLCVLGAGNEIRQEVRVRMTSPALQAPVLRRQPKPAMVVMEAGATCRW